MSDLSIPYRIRLGVTGHRELVDEAAIRERVNLLFADGTIIDLFDRSSKKLIQRATHTPIAFSILTPLAEGADRLVAREVLKIPDSTIEVVLPLAKEDYLQDFETRESRNEFESLLGKARRPVYLREVPLRDELPQAPDSELAAARRRAYLVAGRYVVDHSDVLIAVWDEKQPRGSGGTAEIANYARGILRPVIIISAVSPHAVEVIAGHGLNAHAISGIEMYNSFNVPESQLREYVVNVSRDLFGEGEGLELSETKPETVAMVLEGLLPHYVRVSKIAKRNQNIYRWAGMLVYSFAAAAVSVVALGTLALGTRFEDISPFAFGFELLLLLAVFLIVFISDRRRTHKKWIESRFLAERIRSAIFFAICGIEVSSIHIPPYMGISNRSSDWMIMSFKEIWRRLPAMNGCGGDSCPMFKRYIQRYWLEDQIRYHDKKMSESGRTSHYLEVGGMVVFLVAIAAPALHLLLPALGIELGGMEEALIFAALSLPAVGAAVGGIRSHGEHSRLAKRSESMKEALQEMFLSYQDVDSPEALESLLRKTEEQILLEARDWLTLMKFTKLHAVP